MVFFIDIVLEYPSYLFDDISMPLDFFGQIFEERILLLLLLPAAEILETNVLHSRDIQVRQLNTGQQPKY